MEKPFYIREFFNTYKISNQKIKEIKQIFIDIIHIFQQYQLIKKEGLLMLNRSPINIYDLDTSDRESDHLKSTNGNFVTEEILDQQNWVSEGIGITPISSMDENSSPGFSPTSSFESDVIGITPIDNSQSNNP